MHEVVFLKRKYFVALLFLLAGLYSWYSAPLPEYARESFAMNTLIRMSIRAKNESVLDDAFILLNKLDKMFSMYDSSSDISQINFNAGREKIYVPYEVIEVVKDSERLYALTEGVFNPLIGSVTQLWKINDIDNTKPSQESLNYALSLADISNLEISSDYIYLKSKGCIIDLGGIAKGYASKKIADMLKSKGVKSGLIDLGGNVYAVGKKESGENWNIGVRDPINPRGNPALVLSINDSAVITSGGYERYKTIDGKRYSHFFDPKTGESVMSDILSVTLVTPDGSLADGLATAFMIMGYDRAVNIFAKLEQKPGVIFIRENGSGNSEIIASKNLEGVITRSKSEVKFF